MGASSTTFDDVESQTTYGYGASSYAAPDYYTSAAGASSYVYGENESSIGFTASSAAATSVEEGASSSMAFTTEGAYGYTSDNAGGYTSGYASGTAVSSYDAFTTAASATYVTATGTATSGFDSYDDNVETAASATYASATYASATYASGSGDTTAASSFES